MWCKISSEVLDLIHCSKSISSRLPVTVMCLDIAVVKINTTVFWDEKSFNVQI